MLLDKIEAAGIELSTDGVYLDVSGWLNDEQRIYIREHKQQLIMELRGRSPHCVQCVYCQHFTRTDHPHLGKCNAGAIQSAPAGFWDTHLRGCDKYVEVIQEH